MPDPDEVTITPYAQLVVSAALDEEADEAPGRHDPAPNLEFALRRRAVQSAHEALQLMFEEEGYSATGSSSSAHPISIPSTLRGRSLSWSRGGRGVSDKVKWLIDNATAGVVKIVMDETGLGMPEAMSAFFST